MEVSDWKFSQQFNDLYQRALQLSKEFKNDWGDDPASPILAPNGQPFASECKDDSCKGSALIQWTGNTESLDWLCNPSKKPSQDVINIHRSKTDEEFVCWLMLPKDSSGEQWYFGRVFSRRRPSMPNHVRAFQDIAADAGNLLRRDSQFRDYLAPCLGHIKFVGRFERLQDCLDTSYWCALLFTRPDRLKPWEFPLVTDDIAVVTIDNPFKLTADAIAYWQLAEPNPLPTQFPVARPHKWPEAVTVAAKPIRIQNGKRLTIDQRMKLVLFEKPESSGWSITEFEAELKCSRGGIHKTASWKALEAARKLGTVERRKHRRAKTR